MIARTARKMGYPDPRWILAPQYTSCHLKAGALPLVAAQAGCSLLATLLGLDEQDGYDRLYWRAAPILSCPRHHVFLRTRCPDCQSSIPALRPQSSLCPSCRHGDYRHDVFPLQGDINWLVESQALFLHHLGVETSESGGFLPGESLTLQHLLPPDYFWIVTNFLDLLVGEHGIAFLMQALSFEATVPQHHAEHALRLLHYLLSSWPTHFWVVLDLLQRYLKLHAPRPLRRHDRLFFLQCTAKTNAIVICLQIEPAR